FRAQGHDLKQVLEGCGGCGGWWRLTSIDLHQPPPTSTHLYNLPTRAYGNDGNAGRTPGGWRVQLAEGAHQLDQESQAGGGISRRSARRGAGTLRVEPLVREAGGANRRGRSVPVPARPVSFGRRAGLARGG